MKVLMLPFWYLLFVLFLSVNFYATTNTNILILSLNYTTSVNNKYTFLTSIKYDYEEYPETLKTEFVTKSLKGVPYKYQINSSGNSITFLQGGGYIKNYKISFKQGDLEILENFSNDKHNGIKVKVSFKNGNSTNYSLDFDEVLDIPSILFFLSISNLKEILSYKVLYGGTITNLYVTNITSLEYRFDNEEKSFIRFKKISDKSVVDRFRIEGITIGVFTNATVEGRLVDARIINENVIYSNKEK